MVLFSIIPRKSFNLFSVNRRIVTSHLCLDMVVCPNVIHIRDLLKGFLFMFFTMLNVSLCSYRNRPGTLFHTRSSKEARCRVDMRQHKLTVEICVSLFVSGDLRSEYIRGRKRHFTNGYVNKCTRKKMGNLLYKDKDHVSNE